VIKMANGCNGSCAVAPARWSGCAGRSSVLASAGGNIVPAIARLVQADEDGVRVSQRSDVGLTAETRVEGISCVATRDTLVSVVAASQRSN
jgi:hypothetical protein